MEITRHVGTYGKSYDPSRDTTEFDFFRLVQYKKPSENTSKLTKKPIFVSTGKPGVYLIYKMFGVYINVCCKQYYCGMFKNIDDAISHRAEMIGRIKCIQSKEEKTQFINNWRKDNIKDKAGRSKNI